jgi:hypothetical protein
MEQPLQAQPVYWLGDPLTAELAITGGPTHECYRRLCATTNASPTQSIASWMLTFPVDTAYITTVKIYFRDSSKFISFFLVLCSFFVYVTTGATSGAGTVYPPEHHEFTPVLIRVRVTRYLVVCVCFVDRCFSFCTFSLSVLLRYTDSDNTFGFFKLSLHTRSRSSTTKI